MKFTPIRSSLLALSLVATVSSAAAAQEFGISQMLEESTTVSRDQESQIVIRVRDFSSKSDFCGSGFNLSRLGIANNGFDFPHPGSRIGSYEFPRPGRGGLTGFDLRSGTSATYFQLPNGAKNPDIVGCLDTQRNILFINIRPRVREKAAAETSRPIPSSLVQGDPPRLDRSFQEGLARPTLPAQNSNSGHDSNQNMPAGFPSNYPVIK